MIRVHQVVGFHRAVAPWAEVGEQIAPVLAANFVLAPSEIDSKGVGLYFAFTQPFDGTHTFLGFQTSTFLDQTKGHGTVPYFWAFPPDIRVQFLIICVPGKILKQKGRRRRKKYMFQFIRPAEVEEKGLRR